MSNQATEQQIKCLSKLQHALLNKFYRSHGNPMRANKTAEAWVVHNPIIIAGLYLTPIAEGYWLTSLFVAPEQRHNGIAYRLIKHIQDTYPDSPIWLFCNPDLLIFYQKLGFTLTQTLPSSLSSRLMRYQQSKQLIALQYIR